VTARLEQPNGSMIKKPSARPRPPGTTGTSFYKERGLPFVTMREYRDRRRSPDDRIAVSLANELTNLTHQYPRFQLFINQLHYKVLLQVRSPEWKQRTVLKCLRVDRATSFRELLKTSKLDLVNLRSTLEQLQTAGCVEPCNRKCGPVSPDGKTYYRRRS
jgi:hypothetical protein